MSKRHFDGQTLDHRSPECVWHGKEINQAIDLWSVGVVVAYMCGNPFCEVKEGELPRLIRKRVAQLGAPPQDYVTGYPAWAKEGPLFWRSPKEPSAWPTGMAIALGKSGQQLVSSLFSYHPGQRLSSSEVLEHPFLALGFFPLMGLCREDCVCTEGVEGEGLGRQSPQEGHGCQSFQALLPGVVGQPVHAGERHEWGIRVKEVQREVLLYMLEDEAFLEGTDANKLLVELALGREIITGNTSTPRCVIKGPKTRIGGPWVRVLASP